MPNINKFLQTIKINAMKNTIYTLVIMLVNFINIQAQNKTTVRANSIDISDNLDLRAIAHIFGEAKDLEEFEKNLNDSAYQISNLDLNNDNQVDYLRVIESVENRTHLIIVQAVIERGLFQDVATIEIEKDRNNKIQVQIVGDVYMYGDNYIYEPVYVYNPVIYSTFWRPRYSPYYSPWYWDYYPSYYYSWNPFSVFRYRNHINVYVNVNNTCNYVNYRRSYASIAMHNHHRANGYERQHPNKSFTQRNNSATNRYELTRERDTHSVRASDSRNNTRRNEVSDTRTSKNNSITGNNATGVSANNVRGTFREASVKNDSRNDNREVITISRVDKKATIRSNETARSQGSVNSVSRTSESNKRSTVNQPSKSSSSRNSGGSRGEINSTRG